MLLPDDLTGKLFLPQNYHFHAVLDSTNREAMDLAHGDAPEGTVVVADQQTKGRGRLGRVWVSPPGVNLYFSMILRPPLVARQVAQLTLLAGLALVETLVAAGVVEAVVKWPNDILVHGKKLAGILSEMVAVGERVRFVVIGVGVNVNGHAASFPQEVAERAVTMVDILCQSTDRGGLLAEFLRTFEGWYGRYLQEGFVPVRQGWLGYARLMGQPVRVEMASGVQTGVVLDMDEDGFLLIRQKEGELFRVMAGDVVFI
ncbi:MAG: biotin--[acetyl-CoA-carboxylase] ligase [Magnetococcales bacterium]|nr:biotin--[acetyl-CoA-carboxylase] ligase [Magnetococcales bacterium]MBF0438836.1 biotin--[acetyl-CoA-carboxylase] ligase [Magnetococcales bacterium]